MSVPLDPLTDLPIMPFRNRRALDAQWADALRLHGIQKFTAPQPPEPPPELRQAIEQFNGGEFWECHETLEDVWRESPYPFRLFYHAVIKTAVGFHHLTEHNRHGARVKLRDGVELLELFQPEWMGVRTDLLLTDATEWLSLVEAPAVAWDELDRRAKPSIYPLSLDGRGLEPAPYSIRG
ncbi:MAG: DUF309 domain-containing protein [Dehalococcoidia bacterium]|nr:DUF309 domain-containing protein [Dehalococcoidia bacterium]